MSPGLAKMTSVRETHPAGLPALRVRLMLSRASLLLPCALLALPSPAGAVPVSFRNEVMAVLSRAGCNSGACHGNQSGKGGFRLSLRGEDSSFDFAALTRDTL